MRICSFLPSATEIVFALGLGPELVGVTHECDFPPESRDKPVVVHSRLDASGLSSAEIDAAVGSSGDASHGLYTIDHDRLRGAAPDLVITQRLCEVCALPADQVEAALDALPRRPALLSLEPASLEDMLADVRRVGEAAGRYETAEALVAGLRRRIDLVAERASRSPTRPRVACLEWLDPVWDAGHWIPEMVELAGGTSVLGQSGADSRRVGWQAVVGSRPEVLVLMPCGFDLSRTVREAALLPALPGARVYAVDGSQLYSRSGPRLVDGLEYLAAMIHPELFPPGWPDWAVRQLA